VLSDDQAGRGEWADGVGVSTLHLMGKTRKEAAVMTGNACASRNVITLIMGLLLVPCGQLFGGDAPRKSIPEKKLDLPEYYGNYVVQSSGKTIEIKETRRVLSPDAAPSLEIDSDAEFLIYAKREKSDDEYLSLYKVQWPGPGFVMTFTPEGSLQYALREKSVTGQSDMSRFVPQSLLSPGIYHLRIGNEWYRFVVGPTPEDLGEHQTHGLDLDGRVMRFKRFIAGLTPKGLADRQALEVCLNNLRQIAVGKKQWDELPSWKPAPNAPLDMSMLVGSNLWIKVAPVCPAGGTYKIGAMSNECSCSIHGTVSSSLVLADIPRLIIGTWHSPGMLTTYLADGTTILKFEDVGEARGDTFRGGWSIDGGILKSVYTEMNGKPHSEIRKDKILDINDSVFVWNSGIGLYPRPTTATKVK
jgi:hypothetical protein